MFQTAHPISFSQYDHQWLVIICLGSCKLGQTDLCHIVNLTGRSIAFTLLEQNYSLRKALALHLKCRVELSQVADVLYMEGCSSSLGLEEFQLDILSSISYGHIWAVIFSVCQKKKKKHLIFPW